MDNPSTGKDIDNARKCLTGLNYTNPDSVIQHSISLLQDFNAFKLQLSTIEKNSVEYEIAQLIGPGFTPLQTAGVPYLMHLWLSKCYPLQPPEITLTDFSIPVQFLQPFYNQDTSKLHYSVFYDWNSDSNLTELLLAVNKVLSHTSIAWMHQLTQQTPQTYPNPNQRTNLPPQPVYANGVPPHPHQSTNRFPISKHVVYSAEESAKYKNTDSRRRKHRHKHKDKFPRDYGSREQLTEDLNEFDQIQKLEATSDTVVKIASSEGHSQPVAEITQDVSADLDVSCKPRLTADSNTQSNQELPKTEPSSKPIKPDNTPFTNKKLDPPMQEYITQQAAEVGVKTGEYIQGPFRINQKNYSQGFVYNSTDDRDVLILGLANRNRALPSDIVVVKLLDDAYYASNPDSTAPPSFQDLEQTKLGRIVFISQLKHCRKTVGSLKAYDTSSKQVLFSPRDSRIPRLLIPLDQCPADYIADKRKYDTSIFAAQITEWAVDSPYANGNLLDCLGDASVLEIQIQALLIENDISHDNTFPQDSIDCLPINEWSIPEEEYKKRRDFTKECIFTIDPATARDMDDALHCRKVADNTFEVGVHIADVSYFVMENSPLDLESKKRGTSVYLTHKVVRMLPEVLADKLCSLNPTVERLAFSVVFKMNESCQPYDIWYGRSIIRSCIKMHYELAAEILQEPSDKLNEELKEKIKGQSVTDVVTSVKNLNLLAKKLRDLRIKDGSLILQKIILSFSIDPVTGHPIGFSPYRRYDSHFLIEEFMLLANKLVAQKLAKHFPGHAILRLHPPPNQRKLEKLNKVCKDYGINIDISSAGGMMKTLTAFKEGHDEDENCILSNHCAIPMSLAKYFRLKEGVESLHYALNFELYTHFTSPIRRYPDLMVHRQLAACIGEGPALTVEEVEYDVVTDECNESKTNAKKASTQCNQLFLAYFIQKSGEPLEESGRVMKVLDSSFDVMLTRIGIEVRVYCEQLVIKGVAEKFEFNKAVYPQSITITWKIGEDKTYVEDLKMFTAVKVSVTCSSKDFKLESICVAPNVP